jgi:serine phosphatase RsbU (regulator of sigma subunit)/anti-sigma regulatory factor (Ser/Thr protein kinase)
MSTRRNRWWRALPPGPTDRTVAGSATREPVGRGGIDIAPNDPLLAYFSNAHATVDLDALELDSPALDALRAEGTRLVVPLISQGELIGLLRLGPRRSEQEYSHDDRKLLDDLAAHAAPAVRVAQLVRQQQVEIRERERIEQELKVAQLIQQQFLPRELPDLPGWHVAAYYRPARAVGGDFYDFIELPDGQVGLVVGDVTDKGVPAALVMATTHSVLRGEAMRLVAPGAVLRRANQLLIDEMPPSMFVTCLYAVLDPPSGRLRFANAGHNLPNLRTSEGVTELHAAGMPLGLLPDMDYQEHETVLGHGDSLLLHSDGLAEAHSPAGEMFGFPRLAKLCGERDGGEALIDLLLSELALFTGPAWEQEDDITLVTLQRLMGARGAGPGGPGGGAGAGGPRDPGPGGAGGEGGAPGRRLLDEFEVPSELGTERAAAERVARAVAELDLPASGLEQLKTAVGEGVMNAAEHGNQGRPELPVAIRVTASATELEVAITDQGGDWPIPETPEPDLEAKLAGAQGPRGWGLFLIRNMVDDLRTSGDQLHHTVHLIVHLGGAREGREAGDDNN